MSNFFKTAFGSPTNPQDQMRQMMFQQQLGNLGAGLMQAGAPVPWGQSRAGMFGRAVQAGMPDPRQQMMMMQMQQQAAQQKQKEALGHQLAQAMGGGTQMAGQLSPAGSVGRKPDYRAALQAAMAAGDYNAVSAIQKQMQMEKETAPKLPTGFRLNAQGKPEVIPAYRDFSLEKARANKAQTTVNLPKKASEAEGMVAEIDRLRKAGGEQNVRMADAIEMRLKFGGKPPEAYVKAMGSIQNARAAGSELYQLLDRGASAWKPVDRARLDQAYSTLVLAKADLDNRGANFTDTEQALIGRAIGGNPTDVADRIIRGDDAYKELLRNAMEAIERRGKGLLRAYTTPGAGEYEYPWQKQQAPQQNKRIKFDAQGNMIQ